MEQTPKNWSEKILEICEDLAAPYRSVNDGKSEGLARAWLSLGNLERALRLATLLGRPWILLRMDSDAGFSVLDRAGQALRQQIVQGALAQSDQDVRDSWLQDLVDAYVQLSTRDCSVAVDIASLIQSVERRADTLLTIGEASCEEALEPARLAIEKIADQEDQQVMIARYLETIGRRKLEDEGRYWLDKLSEPEIKRCGLIRYAYGLVEAGALREAELIVDEALSGPPDLTGMMGASSSYYGAITLSKLGRYQDAIRVASTAPTEYGRWSLVKVCENLALKGLADLAIEAASSSSDGHFAVEALVATARAQRSLGADPRKRIQTLEIGVNRLRDIGDSFKRVLRANDLVSEFIEEGSIDRAADLMLEDVRLINDPRATTFGLTRAAKRLLQAGANVEASKLIDLALVTTSRIDDNLVHEKGMAMATLAALLLKTGRNDAAAATLASAWNTPYRPQLFVSICAKFVNECGRVRAEVPEDLCCLIRDAAASI